MLDFFRRRNIIRCTCMHVPLTEGQLANIFKKCDFNGDGYLTKEDLTEAFRQLGSTFPGYRAGRALYRADTNGDGRIDKNKELDILVEYARKRGYRLRSACSTNK